MAITVKQLRTANISPGNNAQYTVGSNKTAVVKSVRLVNKSTTASNTINLVLTVSSTDYQVSPLNLVLAAGAAYVEDAEITMEGGHALKASVAAGGSGSVDYVVSGIERDA
jgi:hypothetical protein